MRPTIVVAPNIKLDIGKHVFPTQKFGLLKEFLLQRGSITADELIIPGPATDADLLTVLTPEYLADMRGYTHTARTMRSELPITREIIEAMVITVGGTIAAARGAMERGLGIHLSGGYHHAYPSHAEGFCYINDIAIAIEVLRRDSLIKRAAVIDTDVHQGNGTAACFAQNDDVYTFSIHQENNYPYPKEKSDLDIGLPDLPGAAAYLAELRTGINAVLRHKPEFVIHAAGVDPYEDDQLGNLGLSKETLAERDSMVAEACHANKIPLVTVVSGGYARNVQDTVFLHAQTAETTMRVFGFLEGS